MNKILKLVIILLFALIPHSALAHDDAINNADNLVLEYLALTEDAHTKIASSHEGQPTALHNESVSGLPLIESKIEQNEIKDDKNEIIVETSNQYQDSPEVVDNATTEFSIFDNIFIDKNKKEEHPFKIEEESLFGKIYKMQVERTDVATHLFKDELTFKVDKGFVDKIWLYGAYQGNFNNLWESDDRNTTYQWGFMDVGMIVSTKDPNTTMRIHTSVRPNVHMNFFQNLFTDVFVMNTRIPNHRIIIGNSRNQVGVEGGSGAYTLPFAARAQISRNFGNTRALGIRVVGNYSLVDYDLAFNSSDRFWHKFFPGPEFTGWLNFKPFGKTDGRYGKLIIGGGINTGKNDFTYTVGSAYVGYTYKKFMANFEYSIADGFNGVVQSDKKASGFYTTVGYKITPKIQLIGRYDHFDPNRDISGNNRQEITAGINYFIKGQAVKLILNYVFCKNQAGPDSNRLIIGTQFLL